MAHESSIKRYRNWYAKLLYLYPKPYYERFGEEMEQVFSDLCREQVSMKKRGIVGFALWIFLETFIEIIKKNLTFIIMQNITKRISMWAMVVILLLMVPLVAMQFNNEMAWTVFDFVFAGVILFGSGLTYELIARKGGNTAYRVAVGIAVVAALLLVWVNGAVGIIGNENNPANLLYFGVIFIGIIGVAAAGLQPHGMMRASLAMAIAQFLVPVIAVMVWRPSFEETPGIVGVFILNAFFVTLFTVSALLFRHAAAKDAK